MKKVDNDLKDAVTFSRGIVNARSSVAKYHGCFNRTKNRS